MTPFPPAHPDQLGEFFEARLQVLASAHRNYRAAAHRFLAYLQTHFTELHHLSDLRRDPHLLGWFRSLDAEDPPLSNSTRRIYLIGLRRLLHDPVSKDPARHPALILREDFPLRPPRPRKPRPTQNRLSPLPHPIFGDIFETHLPTLTATLRPITIAGYRVVVRDFLLYLQNNFPQLRQLSDLRRDPHWLAWLRSLHEQNPPLSNATRQAYLLDLRRLLNDLASQGHSLPPELIVPEDFPPRPRYLPRALSPQDDHLLQKELRRQDDLLAQALLLTRATGIRIGECIDLAVDCLRLLAQDQWALHVPLGKLHTERLVPVDDDVRQMVCRILTLRDQSIYSKLANAASFLLPRPHGPFRVYHSLRYALSQAAQQAGCSRHISCHQLRHTYATEMVRMGVNLPALMQLLGHKDIRMTLRYVQVTQQDLQREYHAARQNAAASQLTATLLLPSPRSSTTPGVTGILQAIAATTHLVEMYRRQLVDEQTSKKVQRLAKRLGSVGSEFRRLATAEK